MKSMIKNALALTLLMSGPVVFAAEVSGTQVELLAERAGYEAAAKGVIDDRIGALKPLNTAALAGDDHLGLSLPSSFGELYDEATPVVAKIVPVEKSVEAVSTDSRWFGGARDAVSNLWNKASYANIKDGVVGYYNNTSRMDKAKDAGKAGLAVAAVYGVCKASQYAYNKYVASSTESTTPAQAQAAPEDAKAKAAALETAKVEAAAKAKAAALEAAKKAAAQVEAAKLAEAQNAQAAKAARRAAAAQKEKARKAKLKKAQVRRNVRRGNARRSR